MAEVPAGYGVTGDNVLEIHAGYGETGITCSRDGKMSGIKAEIRAMPAG